MNNTEIEHAIRAYLDNGIVTKNDVANMGMYSTSEEVYAALKAYIKEQDIEHDDDDDDRDEIKCMKHQVWPEEGFGDYQDVIFNADMFTFQDAEYYVRTKVLNRE